MKDDRGKPCKLLSFWEDPKVEPSRRRTVRRKLLTASSGAWSILFQSMAAGPEVALVIFFGIPMLAIGLVGYVVKLPSWGEWVVGSAGFAFFTAVVAWLIFEFAGRRKRREAIREALCCASCGYDLRSNKPEEDGCTICPECAAAWKLPGEATGPPRDEATEA